MRKAALGVGVLVVVEPFAFAHVLGPTTLTLPKAALAGLIAGLVLRRPSLAVLRAPANRALVGGAAALVIVDALSIIPAVYLDAALRETLKALEYFAAFAAAAVAFADDPDETLVWNAVAVVSALVCVLALVQEATVAPSGFWLHGRIVPRIAGPLEGPNQLAGWLDLMTPLLVARALLGKHVWPFAALATLAVTTDLLALSRSGVVGIVVGVGVIAFLAARVGFARRLMYAAPLAIVPLIAVSAILTFANTGVGNLANGGAGDLAARFQIASEQTVENGLAPRPVLWKAGLQMFALDPGLGIGAGNYELLTPLVGLVGVRTHANSLYVQALAETGLLGFAAILWTIVAAVTTMLRNARGPLLAGIGAGTIGLAVHEAYDLLTFYPKVGELWWLLLGIGAGAVALGTRR
ncbi:MAG: O-antigen ligase family protein [Candidatus Eremiobacteraeota bacterium]|nr:O-antigen ligase family protein [Candidatus Eremiobacteraeota bacterium]